VATRYAWSRPAGAPLRARGGPAALRLHRPRDLSRGAVDPQSARPPR
jgi:hypothetical protein